MCGRVSVLWGTEPSTERCTGRRSAGDPRAPASQRPPSAPQHCAEAPLSPEDLSDTEEMLPKDITKWNSNDLMDKIESPEPEDAQGDWLGGCRASGGRLRGAGPLLSAPAPGQEG